MQLRRCAAIVARFLPCRLVSRLILMSSAGSHCGNTVAHAAAQPPVASTSGSGGSAWHCVLPFSRAYGSFAHTAGLRYVQPGTAGLVAAQLLPRHAFATAAAAPAAAEQPRSPAAVKESPYGPAPRPLPRYRPVKEAPENIKWRRMVLRFPPQVRQSPPSAGCHLPSLP